MKNGDENICFILNRNDWPMASDPAKLHRLTTEQRNPVSASIDTLPSIEIVKLMNREDQQVAQAVAQESLSIAQAIDVITDRFQRGGRLIYIGAGTSGRLGVLDASECPPTFSTPPEMVVGLIAGGNAALTRAVEGAEDLPESGAEDLREIKLTAEDVVVGIASSGRTPYVLGGLEFANQIGAYSIGLSCNQGSELESVAKLTIVPVVGPEVVSGSTRLKAGTATKMILNMLTTGAMIRLGKTYGNLMVDLRATNQKLTARSQRIVSELTGLDSDSAVQLLSKCDGELKTAIVAHSLSVEPHEAREVIRDTGGHLRAALNGNGDRS